MVHEEVRPVQDVNLLAYIDRMIRAGRTRISIQQYQQTFRKLEEYLGSAGTSVADVEPWQMEEFFFVHLNGLAPVTQRNHLMRLRAMFHYAQRRGVIQRDPTHDVMVPRLPDEEPIIIPNEALRRYKRDVRTEQQWAQFHLLAFTGMRRFEAVSLQWEDIDFPAGSLTIRRGKGGKLRHIPLHPQLAEALQEMRGEHAGYVLKSVRSGKPIGFDTWANYLAGFTGGEHTAHDFRRTLASSLALNGVADPLIDKIMGWSPRAVGRRYYIKTADRQLQHAILRAYADDPI